MESEIQRTYNQQTGHTMTETVLFFPNAEKLADYVGQMNCSPVEIDSSHLILKACLSAQQIEHAHRCYEAVSYPRTPWEQLEQWFDFCSKTPAIRRNYYR
jgi:hypothetical protein